MTQSSFEKKVSAGLFVGLLLLGWGMFWWNGWREPYAYPPLMFICAAMAVFSGGMLLDSAGAFTREGKGLYSLAVLVTLPVTGMVAAGTSTFSANAALLIMCGACWLSSKATGDNRPYLLSMYVLLCVVAGVVIGLKTAALAVWLPLILQKNQRRIPWGLLLGATGAVCIGMLAGIWGGFPHDANSPVDLSRVIERLLLVMPWAGWLLPLIIFSGEARVRVASLLIILLFVTAAVSGMSLTLTAAAVAPALALLLANFFVERFALGAVMNDTEFRTALSAAAVALLWLILATDWSTGSRAIIHAAAVTFVLTLAVLLQRLRQLRWAFPLWAVAGLLIGFSTLDTFQTSGVIGTPAMLWGAGVIGLCCGAAFLVFRVLYGSAAAVQADGPAELHIFGGADLRRYQNREWSGQPVALETFSEDSYRFYVFGDVTGADSLVGTRQGGYLGFQRLIVRMQQETPDFCIALGDLASSANELPYRRVRKLLSRVPAPLAVTPGNHDLYDGTAYSTRLFRGLYGADHQSFQVGAVHFVLLNNAYGSLTEEQFAWITGVLTASTATIKLCFAHKPIFDLRADGHYAMEWRPHAEQLHELFQRTHVTAVFSGHIHSFLSETRDGVLYVISGGGGSKIVTGGVSHHFLECVCDTAGLTIRAVGLDAQSTVLFEQRFPSAQ